MKIYHITGGKIAEKYNYAAYIKALDGDIDKVRIVDATADGGFNIWDNSVCAGRHILPDYVPTKVQLGGPIRTLLDAYNFYSSSIVVSDKFKSIIEEVEPGVHQFFPLDVYRAGKLLGKLNWMIIGQRLDTVHDVMPRDARGWPITERGPGFKLIFDLKKIGSAKLWTDKFKGGNNITEDLAKRFEDAGLTGISYNSPQDAI